MHNGSVWSAVGKSPKAYFIGCPRRQTMTERTLIWENTSNKYDVMTMN
jgi:hypothetical protein